MTSLQLLQIDPHGFGGIWLRAPFGPVRDQWLQHLSQAGLNTVKLPGNIDVERLLGGIDLSLTLQSGRLHMQAGLLQQADQGVVLISMAERLAPALIAPMTQAMDKQSLPPLKNTTQTDDSIRTQFGVVALDESMNDDPPMSPSLQERLGLWFDLHELAPADITGVSLKTIDPHNTQNAISVKIDATALARMRLAWPHIQWTDAQALAVCSIAQGLGIDSLRIPTLALRVARCHAALHLRNEVNDEDLAFTARRVLAPRATQLPRSTENAAETEQTQEENSNPNPEELKEDTPPTDNSQENADTEEDAPLSTPSPENLQEMMIAAALASLPSDVLARLLTKPGRNPGNTSGRSGQFRSGSQRGRPLPPRAGRPEGHARLHVLATLRAAAPKQRLRRGAQQGRVAIRS
jgi:magnesium chelatase subunit D